LQLRLDTLHKKTRHRIKNTYSRLVKSPKETNLEQNADCRDKQTIHYASVIGYAVVNDITTWTLHNTLRESI